MNEYLIYWLFFTLIGILIGKSKGRPVAGAFLGFLFGPLGWLLVAVGPHCGPKCPECKGKLPDKKVKRCMHCGAEQS